MNLEQLRKSRNKAPVVFMEFTRRLKEYPSALYCFFEGEDNKYYSVRIENIVRPEKSFYFSCEGKDEVIRVHKILSEKNYINIKIAYFIDRDFEPQYNNFNAKNIYTTPSYSIENFYTSVKCFSNIVRSEFKLIESDDNFQILIDLYNKLQKEFHDAVELLNIWIACQIDKSSELNLRDFKLSNFVAIKLDKIQVKYTIDVLYDYFPKADFIPEEELETRRNELRTIPRQQSFRGKFEIEFLIKILKKIIEEANKKNSTYFTNRIKINFHLTEKNIISQLSQYADTPDCLYKYLESLKD